MDNRLQSIYSVKCSNAEEKREMIGLYFQRQPVFSTVAFVLPRHLRSTEEPL